MNEENKGLLPGGLIDLLPPDAAREADAVDRAMKEFEALGYERVKPPVAEFEESLFASAPGRAVASQTFRMMDPVSRKMMALRSDTTAQIARIASTRLQNAPRPLRLAYAGEVLRVSASQLRTQREFVKAGCELIGSHDVEADIEVAVLALKTLKTLGLEEATIDFTLPPLVRSIYDACDLDRQERKFFDECLERRDRDAIRARGGRASAILVDLAGCMGPAGDALGKLEKADLPEEALSYVSALAAIVKGVDSAVEDLGLKGVRMTLDPLERRGFGYHTGFAFTLFAKGVRGELGRGGRYDISDGGEKSASETAAGFTLYVDTLCQVLPGPAGRNIKRVPADEKWSNIARLQEQGWSVVRELKDGGR